MSDSNSWANQKADFNDLCKLWDKAQSDGIFGAKEINQDKRSDFFGQHDFPEDVELAANDAAYWDDVLQRSGELVPDESMVLMEAARKKAQQNKKKVEKKEDKKSSLATAISKAKKGDNGADGDPGVSKPFARVSTSLQDAKVPSTKEKAKRLAKLNNPISQTTLGRDGVDQHGRVQVSAGLAAHPLYSELESLKLELNKAEEKMIRLAAMAKSTEGMKSTFDRLQKKIDKICRKVTGDYKDSPLRN